MLLFSGQYKHYLVTTLNLIGPSSEWLAKILKTIRKVLINETIISPLLTDHNSKLQFSFRAQDYIVARTQTGLSLSGASCSKLLEQKEGLCAWKTQLKWNGQPRERSLQLPNKPFSKFCLPDFVKSYHKNFSINSVQIVGETGTHFKAMSKTPRFVYPEEMTTG